MVAETQLEMAHLVWPVFVCEGRNVEIPIKTLPDCYRYSVDILLKEIALLYDAGLRAVALFPAIDDGLKNSQGTESLNSQGLVPKAVRLIKAQFPEILVITDIALDPFSSDGHDGIVEDGKILNDQTVVLLAKMAIVHAEAGADFVAPSDMMDGRIGAIRKALDGANFSDVGIISYAAKYASGFYGPFRDALSSAPKFGDKKTYQMDYRNSREAILEVSLDIAEGADIVMVKPALSYLDIIYRVKKYSKVPVAAYNVSGEYAMIKAAAKLGMIDEKKVALESLYSMRRAGADLIFTYFVPQLAEWLAK
jgi:porphobilinogen synthase